MHVHHVKKSTFYLYSKWAFLAAKSKRAILCAMVDHFSEQNRGFLMILINIFS